MDKILSKHLFKAAGISTPDYMVIEATGDARLAADEFGFPLSSSRRVRLQCRDEQGVRG